MATEAAPQVLSTSIDTSGLSVSTTTKTAENPRLGSIYNPITLAAAIPVWFHPLQTGRYLAFLSEHWTGATIGEGGPQTYSDYTGIDTPYWVTVDPVTGAFTDKGEVPSLLSGDRVLFGAVSRQDSVYTVGGIDGEDAGLIQHFRVSTTGQLILQAEELLADQPDVTSVGLYIDGNYLVVLGTDDTTGAVVRRRKHWGRVGATRDPNEQWAFRGSRGWYADSAEQEAELTVSLADTPVASTGSVSYVKVKDREYLATTDGTTVSFWSSRQVDARWRPYGETVTTELLYLQPQLAYNPAALAEGVNQAVCWVATDVDLTDDAESLVVTWGALPV